MIDRRTLLVAGAAVTLAACTRATTHSSTSSTATPTAITVGLTYVPNVQFCAFYLGVQKGLFMERGLDVTLRHHGEQEDAFSAMLGGREGIVFASADEALVAAAEGKDLQTFATSYQTYPLEVIGLGEGASDLSALAGAKLGIPGHYGSSYYAALAAIHEAGLTQADVTLTDIGYTQISALQSKQVDYVMGFSNNEAVQLERLGLDARRIPLFTEPNLVGPSLITSGETVPENVLAKMAAALQASEEAVIADPEAGLEATAQYVPAMAEEGQRAAAAAVLEATMKLWQVNGKVSVDLDTAAFDRMGVFLREAGIISELPSTPYRQVS